MPSAESADQNIVRTEANHQVQLLHVAPDSGVNRDAVKTAADQIVALLQEGKLIPTRVEIFADHPIVKDALEERTMEITVAGRAAITVLVPFSHNGDRVIVKRGNGSDQDYSLFSLPPSAGVDLKACFK
jgi:hypothetical protein